MADVNGDGHPDIITASSDTGSQEGLLVFLSQYDASGHFLGFSAPRFSVLPQLETGDGQTANAHLIGFESPQQISSITAGDYNGDGKVELAVVETSYNLQTSTGNQVTGLSVPSQTLLYLQPEVQADYLHQTNGQPAQVLTGQFYADFGTKGFSTSQQTVPPIPKTPVTSVANGPAGKVIIESSPVNIIDKHDVVFLGIQGASPNVVSTYAYTARTSQTGFVPAPTVLGTYQLGYFDSDRQVNSAGKDDHRKMAKVILQDFSVFDYGANPGTADLAVITNNAYVVGIKGLGDGNGTQDSGGATNGNISGDQAGTNYGPGTNGSGGFDIVHGSFLRVRTGDFDGGAGITTLDDFDGGGIRILTNTFHPGPQTATTGTTIDAGPGLALNNGAGSLAPRAPFDYHYQSTVDPTTEDPGTSDDNIVHGLIFVSSPSLSYSRLGLEPHAGDGGNSLLGAGGIGGSLGSGKITVASGTAPSTGSGIDGQGVNAAITGILNLTVAGAQVLRAGHGGDGFTAGGHGGSIFGVNLQYRGGSIATGTGGTPNPERSGLSVIATAGDGGRGVSSSGGYGGSIGYNSFDTTDTSTTLTAGSGGDGVLGGGGGSIIGNGTSRFDTLSDFSTAIAGVGGNGTIGGGAGGTIINFHSTIPENSGTGASGNLFFQAGTGGSSVSGPGGSGGSIVNSSPVSLGTINGSVSYLAGDAGNGRSGGTGGSVSQLTITTVAPSQPSQLTIHGGLGGDGTAGNGGLGGSLISINVPSKGTLGLFNSVLAGDGGNSGGAAGGAGGSVVSLHGSTTDNSFAVAAGAGGSGLYRGGAAGQC